MLKLSLNLSAYRLQLSLIRRRGANLVNTRSGQKLSHFLRHVFEHKNLKKIFGTNLAVMLIATSFLPTNSLPIEAEENVISEELPPLTTKKGVQYPLKEVKINQGFYLFHPGIDIDGQAGDEIEPIKNGIVEAISNSKYAYGNAVLINHGNGLTSLYAHLSKITVFPGEEVTTLTKIGEVGSTGRSTGSHLHLEIRKDGVPINPSSILSLPTSPVI